MNKNNIRAIVAATVVSSVASMVVLPVNVKALDSQAVYYYTTNGSTPSATNPDAKILVGDTIQLDAPDTDDASTVTVKVVGVRDGYEDSDVATTVVTYGQKAVINIPPVGSALALTLNKSEVPNGYTGGIAMVSNRQSDVDYYFSTDGSIPTPDTGTKLTSSYINIPAPVSTDETLVTVNVQGYKNGVACTDLSSQIMTFKAKVADEYTVSFRDRTYQEIKSVQVKKGESAESQAPTPPDVTGYTFTGWSENIADIEGNMIVRATYDKDESAPTTPASQASYYVVNNGTTSDSYVEVGGAKEGSVVKVYLDAVSDTPCFTATVGANGEAEVVIPQGNLNDSDGQVYVDIEAPTSNFTALSDMGIQSIDTSMLSLSSTPRTPVKYASRAVSQATTQPILASRMTMTTGTNLQVRGIAAGDVVKVYDIDNNVIGQQTQTVNNQVMNITLSKDMTDQDVFASRTSVGLLESQETELTKDVVNSQIQAGSTNQTVANVKLLIDNAIANMAVSNATTKADFDTIIASAIINSSITGTVQSDFEVHQATNDTDGSIVGTIDLVDSSNGNTATCSINRTITKLSAVQTLADVKNIVNTNISNYDAQNTSTQDDFTTAIKQGITDSSIGVTVSNFAITPATATSTGLLKATVTLTKPGYPSVQIDVTNKTIAVLKGASQTNQELEQAILNKVASLTPNNNTTDTEILNDIKDVISDTTVTPSITGFILNPASASTTGTIKANVVLTRTDNSTYTVPITLTIAQLPNTNQTKQDLATAILNAEKNMKATNDTTELSVIADLDKLIQNPNLEISIQGFNKQNATTSGTGYVKGTINIIDTSESNSSTPVSSGGTSEDDGSTTPVIGTIKQTFAEAKEAIDMLMNSITVSNSTDEAYLQYKAEKAVTDNIWVNVHDLQTTPAAVSTTGSAAWIVDIKDNTTGESDSMDYDAEIPEGLFDNGEAAEMTSNTTTPPAVVVTNPTTPTTPETNPTPIQPVTVPLNLVIDKLSSTTNPSTGSHGSGGGGGSSSSNNDNDTTNTGSNSGNSSNSQVVTPITGALGQTGVTAGTTTQYNNADGSKDTITIINKGGSSIGSVITSGTSGSRTVHIGNTGLSTVFVYKYIPQISKFVPVALNVVVSDNSITLSTETGVNYLVSVTPVDTTAVAKQGWNQNNAEWFYLDNNMNFVTGWVKDANGKWYFMDKVGLFMKTGWLNDNGTWYLLDNSGAMVTGWQQVGGTWYYLNGSGAMETGWVNDNGTWYYMKDSGAMATGWLNDNGTWYYLNADGSMAHDTTISGYTLASNGKLI